MNRLRIVTILAGCSFCSCYRVHQGDGLCIRHVRCGPGARLSESGSHMRFEEREYILEPSLSTKLLTRVLWTPHYSSVLFFFLSLSCPPVLFEWALSKQSLGVTVALAGCSILASILARPSTLLFRPPPLFT
jgi:hypothetical protein